MLDSIDWSRGYPVSETYPASWHSFQSPAHLRMVCAVMGVAWEVGPETPLSIAEVGCGTGYTSHMLAAGNPHWQVLGLDYNPAHIAEARSMTAAARLDNLRFIEADLADLRGAELDRLPELDLVTVHGVWSWVADPVREGVLRLIMSRLKPGGLVLVTYNALPGAAGGLGLARLVRQMMLGASSSVDAVQSASTLVKRLIEAQAPHMAPSTWRRVVTGEVAEARPGYIRHEFQTEHWRPSFFSDVADAMASVRCEYVGSATLDENFPQLSLTAAQRELWNEAADVAARELIFDFCVPRAFRRDLYVRGLRRVPRDAAVEDLWLTSISRSNEPPVIMTQAGEAKLPVPMIAAVRAELESGPRTVRHLRSLPGCDSATPAELLAVLVGSGCAAPLWRQPGSGPDWDRCVAAARRLNAVAADRLAPHGVGSSPLGLATPALGGGLRASCMELAVARLLADRPQDLPSGDGFASLIDGLLPRGAEPPPEVRSNLESMVSKVLSDRVPIWRQFDLL